ncbi:MAG: thiol:disulfide interchange protein DsbA/DsbL [Magnetococcales bacterium]|nr:thiol:disulfide interchange protein DsbA/DsbL [Magnetococcales bacterium]
MSLLFLTAGLHEVTAAPPIPSPVDLSPLQAGVHYDPISPVVPRTGDKPEVIEIFNFKCPHCFSLAPHTAAWAEKNKERFVFKSVPVYWGKQTDVPARAFFAAEFMGKGEAMKQAIFKAHFDHSANIENIEDLMFLAEAVGLDQHAFRNQMNAFGVSAKLSQAKAMQQAFRTSSTPTLVVNGAYQILPGKHARGDGDAVQYDKLFRIVETLAVR